MSELGESILKAQVANVLKKSQAGKVLSSREEKILADYQESQKPPAERRTWISGGKHGLGVRVGVKRLTIDRWSKFPDFPKVRSDGDYPLEDVLSWIKSHGFKGGEQSEGSTLRDRETKARIDKLEFELEVEKGKYILISEMERIFLQCSSEAQGILRAKFENEIPADIVGLDEVGVQRKCRDAIDEVCQKLSSKAGA